MGRVFCNINDQAYVLFSATIAQQLGRKKVESIALAFNLSGVVLCISGKDDKVSSQLVVSLTRADIICVTLAKEERNECCGKLLML